ncbi:hypothetical protein JTE90_019609 [Oedothorax gibbosus]|uniref:Uncharacterized protein n=1 Tax=Oedothorax gibbosus TaxID=931172 RepID=A0AAV6V4A4_9ARAC|nr:hypothetical protein JTE90_019609 [Oedothorax gibbosus]
MLAKEHQEHTSIHQKMERRVKHYLSPFPIEMLNKDATDKEMGGYSLATGQPQVDFLSPLTGEFSKEFSCPHHFMK